MFTSEQIQEIEQKLALRGKKDTQFPLAQTPLRGDETIAIVQAGENVQLNAGRLVDNLILHGISDFLNITNRYNLKHTTLKEAVYSIHKENKKLGQVICFSTEKDTWEFYQYIGTSLNTFHNIDLWKPLVRCNFRGLYNSEQVLKQYNPYPEVGNYAYVKQENPDRYYLYQCDTEGIWTNQGDLLSLIADLHITGDISISKNNTWVINDLDTGINIYPKNIYWEQITDRPITWEDLVGLLKGDIPFALQTHTHTLADLPSLEDFIGEGVAEELNKKADKDHNHDTKYANIKHTHDEVYASKRIENAILNMVDSNGNPIFNEEGIVIPNTGTGEGQPITNVISTGSTIPPTNDNVFSSLKTLESFLRKDKADIAKEKIDFLDGLSIGEFVDSFQQGQGANIDKVGNIKAESVEVRGYIKVLELIYNRLNAVEGDQVFTESGVVEEIVDKSDNIYTLKLRQRWEGDFHSFQKDDVLRGVVNNLNTSGDYHTSWGRVIDIDKYANQITVLLYKDSETKDKQNFPITTSMVLHRWGNAVKEDRQSTWYISATEGRIVFLQGVTKPILEEYNYASFWGKPLPLKVFEGKPINYNQPYAYLRGLLVEDLIKVDYNGAPIITIVNAGPWQDDQVYNDGSKYPYIQHDVYHNGVIWRCIVDNATEEPKFNSTQWAVMSDNTRFILELYTDAPTLYRPNTEFEYSLVAKVFHGQEEITSLIRDIDWKWERKTGDKDKDNAWNESHSNSTQEITLTYNDMGMPENGTTSFKCEVFIKDGDRTYNLKRKVDI